MTGRARRRSCTAADARTRAAHAQAYLETAKLIGSEADKPAIGATPVVGALRDSRHRAVAFSLCGC